MTERNPNNPIESINDPEAAVLVEQVSTLVDQFDEIIRLLGPTRKVATEEEPMIFLLSNEEDSDDEGFPGVALVLASPTEVLGADGEIDQEFLGKLIKKAGKALRKVNWKKVGKVVGGALKGGLKGIAGGPLGIIKGAALGGIGSIVKGSGGKSRPSQPAIQQPGGQPIVVSPGTVTPGVTQLGHGGAPVINQYITHNCGPGGKTQVGGREDINAEWHEVDEATASEGDCGGGPHESHAERESLADDILDEVYPTAPLAAEYLGETSGEDAVLEFLESIREVRDLLSASLPTYEGFEWEQEASHE